MQKLFFCHNRLLSKCLNQYLYTVNNVVIIMINVNSFGRDI